MYLMIELIITLLLYGCSSSEKLVLFLHFYYVFDGPSKFPRKKCGSPFSRVKTMILFCFLAFFVLLMLVLSITQTEQQGWIELQDKPLNLFHLHGPIIEWCFLQGTLESFWCVVLHVSKVVREVVPSCLASDYALINLETSKKRAIA